MGKYDINSFSRSFFPWFWQNVPNLSLVDVLMSVFNNVNNEYALKELDFTERVGYSIQRLSLETGLNNRYDLTLQRIAVINGEISSSEFVFNEGEALPAGEKEKYIFNEGEALPGDANQVYFFQEGEGFEVVAVPFTVSAPLDIQTQEQSIRAFIEAVLITSTEYNLIFA